MATTSEDYDRKFAEMQKYIPFLENMIDRLKNVDKPRAPQLDKIQSLYNIVTNSKKKLKYETLIKCEEGLKKLYEKVGKADTTTKPLIDYRQPIQSVKQNFDCSSAPASPSPPSTPDPAPKAPILIPTERKLSPIRNIKPFIERPIEPKHNADRDHKKNHHNESSSYHKHRHRTKSIDGEKWRSESDTKDDNFGIYSKGILKHKKDEPVISPPLNEPPLTSADIADLLSENAEVRNEEQLDIEKLENIRAQLVNQIKEEDRKGGKSPNAGEDVMKINKITEKKKDIKDNKVEKPHTTSKTITIKETDNKTKPKTIVVEKKEVENKFGNFLSSIDEQIIEKNKDQKKEMKVKDKDKEKSHAKPTETEKSIQKKDEVKKIEETNKVEEAKKVGEIKKIEEVKKVEEAKKIEELKKMEEEKKIENEKSDQTYVRLADKYHRKPRSDKPINDVNSDDTQTYQEKAPGNITGRGLTMKELERFGGGFESQQQMPNFSPPHHNNNPNIITYPNDPRMKRVGPQTHNLPWMHQQQSQINQSATNQNSQMYPQDIYSPGPPSTPSDPFNNTSRNMYNNIQVPLQETFPQPLFNQNKNFHQFNQNLSNQYDLSKMNPINYYETPNQYHTNNKPGLLGSVPTGFTQKIPLLSPPQNQSPLYNNQNMYNVQPIPSLLTGAKGPPPIIRNPIHRDSRDPRDIRDHRDSRDPRDSRDHRDSRDPRDSRDSRDPRDPRRARFDSNIRSDTTDRYNQNRNTINNRQPEKKVFRGYDPRPQPRLKKEPERTTIDGLSNIPTPGALNSFKIPKLKREEIIEEKSEIVVDTSEPDTSMTEPTKTDKIDETDNETDKTNNTATQNPEISTSNSNENELKESKESKTSETKVDPKKNLIENFVKKLYESGEADTFLELWETIKEETKKHKEESENVEQSSDKKTKSKAGKASIEKSSTDKPTKMKRRNDLEMLQDDIREMFISEGVLTANGQRMCRLLNDDDDKDKDGEEVKNFLSLRKLRSGKDIISDEEVSPSRRTRATRQSRSLVDTPPLELPVRTRNRIPRVVIEKSNIETIKSRTSIDEKEVEKVCKQQRKSVKKVGLFEESTTDVNVCNLFLKRNLKVGKKCSNRRRIILKTKIYNVIKKLVKLKKLKIDEQKTLKTIFENKGNEETLENTKTVVTKPAKTLGVKLIKRKGKRGKAWSTGVLKRKAKKNDTDIEKDKEIETDEVINAKTEISSINYPDKEYCFKGPGKYNCKICAFSGKSIILHYRSAHPNDEIMISRLHMDNAKTCIDESIKNDYDSLKQVEEILNCAGFPRRKRFNGFKCRFCDMTITNEFTKSFYSHLVAHTGEYSFGCSHCKFSTISKPSLRTHVSHSHPGKKFNLIQFYPNCKNYTILFGYLCGECNFVQLHEENVQKHIKRYHADKLVRIYKINMSSIATEAVENKSELARLKKEMDEKQSSIDDETMDVDEKEGAQEKSLQDSLDKSEDTEISFSDQSISPINKKIFDDEKTLRNTEKKTIEKTSMEEKSIVTLEEKKPSAEKKSMEEQSFAEEKSIEIICKEEKSSEKKKNHEKLSSKESENKSNSLLKDENKDQPQKECELNVFVCPDELVDEQKIQDERLKIMQEVAEAVCQTRRTSFQFLDNLKLRLESSEESEENNDIDSNAVEVSSTPKNSDDTLKILDTLKSKLNKKNTDENVSTEEKIDDKESNGKSPNSIEDIPQIFDNDDDLDNVLIDEVLNMENDWSKWSTGKSNSTMMNTIQRLANVVKQSNEPSTSLPTAETIKYHVGPVTAEKTGDALQYLCSSNSCTFASDNKELFTAHVLDKHLDFWDGECNKCDMNIQQNDVKLTCKDALEHLFIFHLELSTDEKVDEASAINKPMIRMRRLSGDKLSMSPDVDRSNITDTDSNTSNDLIIKNLVSFSEPSDGLEFKIQDVRTLNPDELETSPIKIEPKTPTKTILIQSPIKTLSPGNPMLKSVPALIKTSGSLQQASSPQTPKVITQRLYINKQMACKDSIAVKKMLEPAKLAHIFKCMAKMCTFSTDEANTFLWHLNTVKTPLHMNEKDWGTCPYCPEQVLSSAKRLELHILHEHGECRFQCGYCFYRAASQTLVERHQCEHHGSENFRVYQLEPRGDYNEYKKQMPLKSICKPYICPLDKCKVEIYLRENFIEHVEQHADMDMYACQLCSEKRESMLLLIQHYTKHNIGYIQCLYCSTCTEYEHTMKDHLGRRHPNQSPKVLFRKINPALKTVLKIREPINPESLLRHLFICNLDLKTTHFSKAIPVPSTPFNFTTINTITEINLPPLTAISSSTTSVATSSATSATPFSDNLLLFLNENETNNTTNSTTKDNNFETNLEDENSHLNELIESTLKETENDGKQPNLDLFKDNITENSKEMDIPIVVDLENSDEDDVTNQVDPLALEEVQKNKIEKDIPTNNDAENENPKQLVNSLDDIQSTGLNGKALYRCGTSGCDHSSETLASFKDHLFTCDTSQDSSMFRCFHCKKMIKYLNSLVDHIKRHGLARYGCSLCNYRSAVVSSVAKHMKDRHKITQVRTIPLDPFKSDLENDLFVVCPQGKSTSTLKRKNSNRDLDHTTTSQAETKMVFAPNEVDLLPRQPILPFDMKCAQCSYTTKVRTNMVRHLLFHSNSVAVPESAPVNPVPCLEKNEKMFDKMVNLANSSFKESSRMGGKQTRKSSVSNEDLHDLPGFIPENKRFVCGANACNYLTVDDSMLRCHFRALHMDEINYKCPHCPEHLGSVVSIDKIGIHLKMHDARLYKCSHCSYYHYQKYVVERHLSEKHSDKPPYVHVIRELDADGNDERKDTVDATTANDATSTQPILDGKPWRCGLCKMRTVTRTEIIDHAKTAHSVKSQFMCSLCQYRCSYDKGFEKHFNSKHPGLPIDMISVYYKDETVINESTVSGANTSTAEVFDTTPLWRRDMPRIRHIRGILFEETQTKQTSPRKSAKTTSAINDEYIDIEYLEDDVDTVEYVKKTSSKRRKSIAVAPTVTSIKDTEENVKNNEVKEKLKNTNLKLNVTYSCSICNKFTATTRKEFAEHLCEEMNYEKFICTYCSKRSHSFDWMKSHLDIAHGKPWKPEFIVSLTGDENIESFILNEINKQEKESGETEKVSNYVKLENLKEIFGFPSEHRHKNTELNSSATSLAAATSSSTTLGESLQYPEEDSEYEEIDQTNNDSSSIHKIKDLTSGEDCFVDPRQTDRNKCPHCSYFSKYPRDVTKHIIRHWEEQPYQCGYCNMKGSSIMEIVKHNSQRHRIKCKVIKLVDPKNIKTRAMKVNNRRKTIDHSENPPQIKKIALETPPKNPPEINKIVTPPKKEVEEEDEEDIKPPILENETERDMQSSSIEEPTIDPKDPVVYLCHYCPKQSDTVKTIYDHWQATHKERFSKGSFKFRTLGKSQIPPRVRGRVLCKICGYRGSKQNVHKHHKQMHAGQQLQIDDTTPPPSADSATNTVKPTRINCKNCLYYCYSLVAMGEHYTKVHDNGDMFKMKFAEELLKQEESSIKLNTASAVQCKWCQEICKDEKSAKDHHILFHSHLKLSVTPVAKTCIKYACPNCTHTSESHLSMIEHFRSHVKPFICGYCDIAFSFPHHVKIHTVKKHTGLEPKFEAVEKLQQELTEIRNKLMVILEDGTRMLYNEYKISKRKSEEDPAGCSAPVNKVMKMDVAKKSPVAKKSTTFVPKPRILQVARKSTTPRVNNPVVRSPAALSMELMTEDGDKYYSFYGKKPITDNSRITTTMNLGGTQMKVNISTLMQLTNMLPVLRIHDLKNQRMIL